MAYGVLGTALDGSRCPNNFATKNLPQTCSHQHINGHPLKISVSPQIDAVLLRRIRRCKLNFYALFLIKLAKLSADVCIKSKLITNLLDVFHPEMFLHIRTSRESTQNQLTFRDFQIKLFHLQRTFQIYTSRVDLREIFNLGSQYMPGKVLILCRKCEIFRDDKIGCQCRCKKTCVINFVIPRRFGSH